MKRLLAFASTLAAIGALAGAAQAQVSANPSETQTIVVPKDKSAAFRLDYPASEIVVAQPDTLSLVATTDRSFYVRGKAIGVTNILIYDTDHHLAQVVDVRVGYDTDSLQSDLAAALPGENIHAANFAGGILLTGDVSTPNIADRAAQIAEHYAPKAVESELRVAASQQVQVDVRIIEASHSAIRDLGFNVNVQALGGFNFSTGSTLPSGIAPQGTIGVNHRFGAWNIDANIQALEQKGAIRELARPNLVAMSGQEATFLAGGEFPVPIPNGNLGTTIEFREFGVRLNVTPTVEDNGQIVLKVAPEVSELDPKDGVNIQGFQVPAIESFAIAGLFQRNYSNTINQIPGAGNLPILGALFRSSDWQRNETELVIIVTPHLTNPVRDVAQLPNPLHDSAEASAIDVILDGKSVNRTAPNPDGDLRPSPAAAPPESANPAPPQAAASVAQPQAAQPAATPVATAAAPAVPI
jgi:pilus assembly protein CpaC